MKTKHSAISIRLNDNIMAAYRYLQSKKINPAIYLREGGEAAVWNKAIEFKYKPKEDKLPF